MLCMISRAVVAQLLRFSHRCLSRGNSVRSACELHGASKQDAPQRQVPADWPWPKGSRPGSQYFVLKPSTDGTEFSRTVLCHETLSPQ
jgi:hypothetical protein